MRIYLERLAAHMEWADAKALKALRGANPVPPVALELFGHVLGAESIWRSRLELRPSAVAVWPGLTLGQCATISTEMAAWYKQLLATLSDAQLEELITYRTSAGDEHASLRSDILLQVFLHGCYHRGQIAATLRESGAEPEPTDYIAMRRGAPAARTKR